MCQLSIVVITLNEEERISMCLESLIQEAENINSEIILVDSMSDDNTIEIAKEYPVEVYQIKKEKYRSPAMGRAVGQNVAAGDNILFVDGDIVVSQGWLPEALDYLREKSNLAGITGPLNTDTGLDKPHQVERVSGVMLFDANKLGAVGGFDPSIKGAEDHELSYRLTNYGYNLIELPYSVGYHPRRDYVKKPLRRLKRGYYLGTGQILRKHINNPTVMKNHIMDQNKDIASVLWIFSGLLTIIFQRKSLQVLWASISFIVLLVLSKKKGTIKTMMYPIDATIKFVNSIYGFIVHKNSEEEFRIGEKYDKVN